MVLQGNIDIKPMEQKHCWGSLSKVICVLGGWISIWNKIIYNSCIALHMEHYTFCWHIESSGLVCSYRSVLFVKYFSHTNNSKLGGSVAKLGSSSGLRWACFHLWFFSHKLRFIFGKFGLLANFRGYVTITIGLIFWKFRKYGCHVHLE